MSYIIEYIWSNNTFILLVEQRKENGGEKKVYMFMCIDKKKHKIKIKIKNMLSLFKKKREKKKKGEKKKK